MRRSLRGLALLGLLAAGCGEVVIGVDDGRRADLRVEGHVLVVASGDAQTVSGQIRNAGHATAEGVRVSLTPFVAFPPGFVSPWTTAVVAVESGSDGSDRLRPGELGLFEVVFVEAPPIVEVDVEVHARFPALGRVFFFFFSPGLTIIIVS